MEQVEQVGQLTQTTAQAQAQTHSYEPLYLWVVYSDRPWAVGFSFSYSSEDDPRVSSGVLARPRAEQYSS